MAEEKEIKRFTAKKKAELVIEIFQGKSTVSELARKYDLTPATIEEWMEEAHSRDKMGQVIADSIQIPATVQNII